MIQCFIVLSSIGWKWLEAARLQSASVH